MRLSDKFTTGSSIMPQKRNPDAAELVRAKTGRIAGAFQALLMVMKGLPLAYAKDMQEDKEPVFDALDALKLGIAAMTGMVEDLEPDLRGHEARRSARAMRPPPTSPTGWCASSGCRSGRRTTSPAGSWRWPKSRGSDLKKLPLSDLQSVEKRITEEVYSALDAVGLGQKPHQLWGNRARQRQTAGETVDKAFGEGRRNAIKG